MNLEIEASHIQRLMVTRKIKVWFSFYNLIPSSEFEFHHLNLNLDNLINWSPFEKDSRWLENSRIFFLPYFFNNLKLNLNQK